MQETDIKRAHTELNALTDDLNDAITDLEDQLGKFGVPAVVPCPGKPGFSYQLKKRDNGFTILFVDDLRGYSVPMRSASRDTRLLFAQNADSLVREVFKTHMEETQRVHEAIIKTDALTADVVEELKKREI